MMEGSLLPHRVLPAGHAIGQLNGLTSKQLPDLLIGKVVVDSIELFGCGVLRVKKPFHSTGIGTTHRGIETVGVHHGNVGADSQVPDPVGVATGNQILVVARGNARGNYILVFICHRSLADQFNLISLPGLRFEEIHSQFGTSSFVSADEVAQNIPLPVESPACGTREALVAQSSLYIIAHPGRRIDPVAARGNPFSAPDSNPVRMFDSLNSSRIVRIRLLIEDTRLC